MLADMPAHSADADQTAYKETAWSWLVLFTITAALV